VAQGEEWQSYSSARSAFMDFEKDSYQDNPELYEAVGWNEDTFEFATNWVFLSDEITEDAFRYITDNSETSPDNASMWHRLKTASLAVNRDRRLRNMLLATVIVMAVSFVWIAYRGKWQDVLLAALNGMAVTILILYPGGIVGRIIFRKAFIIYLQ